MSWVVNSTHTTPFESRAAVNYTTETAHSCLQLHKNDHQAGRYTHTVCSIETAQQKCAALS